MPGIESVEAVICWPGRFGAAEAAELRALTREREVVSRDARLACRNSVEFGRKLFVFCLVLCSRWVSCALLALVLWSTNPTHHLIAPISSPRWQGYSELGLTPHVCINK